MKGIMVALLSLILLSACGDKSVFMGRHNVASGDYYLTFSAGNVRLLIDDQQILKKYQQELRVEKAARTKTCTNPMQVVAFSLLCAIPHYQADYSLKLMHKKKGLIRELKYGETYHLPQEMDNNVKILGATETWGSADDFIKRVEYLKNLKGISTVKADTPPYSHLVNIYFPLRVAPLEEDFDLGAFQDETSRTIEKTLRERFSQEMEKRGIKNYQIVKTYHQNLLQQVNYDITDHRVTTSRPVIILHSIYQTDYQNYLYLTDYRADLFSMQVNCDDACAQQIEGIRPLDWLASPVNHEDFIDKLKFRIAQNGGIFNPEFIFDIPRKEGLAKNYFLNNEINKKPRDDISGGIVVGKRRFDLPESLLLSWQYDLQHAFNHSATELAKPVMQPILEHRSN